MDGAKGWDPAGESRAKEKRERDTHREGAGPLEGEATAVKRRITGLSAAGGYFEA